MLGGQKGRSEALAPDAKRLPREFFTRDGLTVAKDLLGKVLVHETPVGPIRGVITEVESYMGINDKGSHTYGGRRTERTEPMFRQGGNSYVYFTYGMYYCMNITSGVEGDPQAVLIRSVEPADEESKERMLQLRMAVSIERAQKRGEAKQKKAAVGRKGAAPEPDAEQGALLAEVWLQERLKLRKSLEKHLADGPGKMCIAMGITKADNAVDMIESPDFYVTEGIAVAPDTIKYGKRIGIDYAQEAADYLWRFYL